MKIYELFIIYLFLKGLKDFWGPYTHFKFSIMNLHRLESKVLKRSISIKKIHPTKMIIIIYPYFRLLSDGEYKEEINFIIILCYD